MRRIERETAPGGSTAANILAMAAWFGLVTGLFEGTGFLLFQSRGGLMDVPPEILAVTPPFDLVLFALVGVVLLAVRRGFPRAPLALSAFLLAFLAFLDLLAVMLTLHLAYYALMLLAAGLATQVARWVWKHESAAVRLVRRSLPWVAAAGVLVVAGVQGGRWLRERNAIASLAAAARGAPNVLIVVVDTLRADHLSAYGYTRPTSPAIDRLAHEGVLFENAFSTAPWTLPAHVSLLTGLYLSAHGADWNTPRALCRLQHPTLGEVLRQRGYRTGAFSANLFWFTRSQCFGRGFIHFDDYYYSVADMLLRTLYGRAFERLILRSRLEDLPARRRASDVNRAFFGWIDAKRRHPFFAFLNYLDTHDPYVPPQPYRSRFSTKKKPGGMLNMHAGRAALHMTAAQARDEVAAYDGAIAYVDNQIQRLLAGLENRGLARNTLVVITSDHGEAFGEHGTFLHGKSLYREELHVPLVFWQPGAVPGGVRIERPVSNAALPATVMDLTGATGKNPFPLISLARLWRPEEPPAEWPDVAAEVTAKPWARETAPVHHGSLKSLVTLRWHYIWHEKLGPQLYEWKNDPLEANNLVHRLDLQETVAELRARLNRVSPPRG